MLCPPSPVQLFEFCTQEYQLRLPPIKKPLHSTSLAEAMGVEAMEPAPKEAAEWYLAFADTLAKDSSAVRRKLLPLLELAEFYEVSRRRPTIEWIKAN